MALDPASLVALSELAARPGVPADELGAPRPAPAPVPEAAPRRPWAALLGASMEPLQSRVAALRMPDLALPDLDRLGHDWAAALADPAQRRRLATLAGSSVAAGLVAGLIVPTAAEASASAVGTAVPASAALLPGTPSPFADVVPAAPRPAAAAPAAAKPAPATPAPAAPAAPRPAAAASAAAKPAPATPAPAASPAATVAPTRARTAPVVVVADPLPPHVGARPAVPVAAAAPGWRVTRPLPANSGTGRRIVYAERAAHLWVVDADGTVLRDYKVTGRADRPKAGTYRIYSKSVHTSNPKQKLRFDLMVRFAHGVTGAPIGFHTIPVRYDGTPIQRERDLGRAIGMGGCVRQSRADAEWLYAWSRVGDRVVVLH